MQKIYILSGPDLGKSFVVESGATFGRAPDCAVPLRDASVSRYHAKLERDGDAWSIVDTGSRNGLMVRGERVTSARVADGDEFALGEVMLRLRVSSDVADGQREQGTAPNRTATAPASPPNRIPLAAPGSQSDRVSPSAPISSPNQGVGAPSGISDVDEIELEGDWDATAASAPISPRTSAPDPIAAPTNPLTQTARERATAKLAAAGALPKSTASRGILQYNKVEARDGFANAELGQQPLWIKTLVALLALALFAAVFWTAFRGTTWLKGKPAPAQVEENEEAPR